MRSIVSTSLLVLALISCSELCPAQLTLRPGIGQLADTTGLPASGIQSLPESKFRKKWNMAHSPLKATVYSAMLPGAGQIYNRKFWKLPIVYGGLGTCVYFIARNTREYHKWRDSYIAANDGDPGTIPQLDPNQYRLDYAQDLYRRYTEISYMCLIGVYVLQLIDANVDAHMFYFDVSPDLSMRLQPSLIPAGHITPAFGISLHL